MVGDTHEEKQRGEEVDGRRIKGCFCKGGDKQSTRRSKTMLVSSGSPCPESPSLEMMVKEVWEEPPRRSERAWGEKTEVWGVVFLTWGPRGHTGEGW